MSAIHPMTDIQLLTECEALCAAAYMAAKGTGEKDCAEARAQCAAMVARMNAVLNPPQPELLPVPKQYLFDEDAPL